MGFLSRIHPFPNRINDLRINSYGDDVTVYGIAYYVVYYCIPSAESYYSSGLLASLIDSNMME